MAVKDADEVRLGDKSIAPEKRTADEHFSKPPQHVAELVGHYLRPSRSGLSEANRRVEEGSSDTTESLTSGALGPSTQATSAVVVAMAVLVAIGKWIQTFANRQQEAELPAAVTDRARLTAAQAASILESSALDERERRHRLEFQEMKGLKNRADETNRRAAREQLRLATMRKEHRRELARLREDVEVGKVLNGRLKAQVEAEREVSDRRQETLEKRLVVQAEEAKRAEGCLAAIEETLKKEKDRVLQLLAEKDTLAASLAKRATAAGPERTTSAVVTEALQLPPPNQRGLVTMAKQSAVAQEGATGRSEENLWLPSPTRMVFPRLCFGEGVDEGESPTSGEDKDDERERSRKAADGPSAADHPSATDGPSATLVGEIKREFLRKVREEEGDAPGSVSTQLAALSSSLSPTSSCFHRQGILSDGEFATVTVVNHELGRFALKEIKRTAGDTQRNAARQEMRILSRLAFHPNIIGVMAVDDTLPTLPILMELAAADVFTVLEAGDVYSVLQKISFLRDAAVGLLHMHSKGWVHIDVKAENLLIVQDDTGKNFRGKIADVGLTRRCGVERLRHTGTPGYIPFENLAYAVAASYDQDVFSLAVLALMLFLRPDIGGNNVFALDELLTAEELDEAAEIEKMGETRIKEMENINFDTKVTIRTIADGSFERVVLRPNALSEAVPLKDKVCEWLKACLSPDPSSRLPMEVFKGNLNELVTQPDCRC